MRLRAAEQVGGETLTSAAIVLDLDVDDEENGNVVAFVIFAEPSAIIYWHRAGYDDLEVLVAAEKFLGQTLRVARIKAYDVTVRRS